MKMFNNSKEHIHFEELRVLKQTADKNIVQYYYTILNSV